MKDLFILMPISDVTKTRAIIDTMSNLPLCRDNVYITLLHIFRKAPAEEELMGKKCTEEEIYKCMNMLEQAKNKLVESGFKSDHIELKLTTDFYPTVTEGIIDQFNKSEKKFDLVMIRRRKMSKAEEFLVGDVSVKLIRALEGTAVLVLKPS